MSNIDNKLDEVDEVIDDNLNDTSDTSSAGTSNNTSGTSSNSSSNGSSNKRVRNFTTNESYYYYTHDANGNVINNISVDDWFKIVMVKYEDLVKSDKADVICVILHNNDWNEKTNTPVSPHLHTIISLKNASTQSALMNYLKITRKENCEIVNNKNSMFKYLLHITPSALNNSGKYIYGLNDIKIISKDRKKYGFKWLRSHFVDKTSNNKVANNNAKKINNNTNNSSVNNNIGVNVLSLLSLLKKDSSDEEIVKILLEFVSSYFHTFYSDDEEKKVKETKFISDLLDIYSDGLVDKKHLFSAFKNNGVLRFYYNSLSPLLSSVDKDKMNFIVDYYSKNNACKTTVLISGGGGDQKTELAQNVLAPHFAEISKRLDSICNSRIHVPSSPMRNITYDPVGKYTGESVSVLNEINGNDWFLESFCDILDPIHAGFSASRHFDKAFYPDWVFFTTSDNVDTFVKDMYLKWYSEKYGKKNLTYIIRDNVIGGVRQQELCSKECYGINKRPYDSIIMSVNESSDSIWNKIWQVRRRVPITITLNKGLCSISVLRYDRANYYINNSNCYDMFISDLPYSVTDETIKNDFLSYVEQAIVYYYHINKHMVTPWSLERPTLRDLFLV